MTSYKRRHIALTAEHGRAADWPCAAPGCGAQAHDWALVGAPSAETPHRGWNVLADAYRPLCRSHHLMLDRGGDFEHCPKGHDRAQVGVRGSSCRACDRDASRERARRARALKTTRTSGSIGRPAATERNPS